MRWNNPTYGDIKIVKKFLFLPLTISFETRWLEEVTIEYIFKPYSKTWCPLRFLDNEEKETNEDS